MTVAVQLNLDHTNPVNATGDNVVCPLPTNPLQGQWVEVEKTDSSANTVTITGAAQGTIVLTGQNQTAGFIAGPDNAWHVTGQSLPSGTFVQVTSEPARTVSPVGRAQGYSTNNGADYGPDTPGTTTSGIQEAFNSLPAITLSDSNLNQVAGRKGWVHLLPGVFSVSTGVVIPAGTIKFTGSGCNAWASGVVAVPTSPTQDTGGSIIVGSNSAAQSCVQFAYPQAGTLGSGLSTGGPITSIPLAAPLPNALSSGETVWVGLRGSSQVQTFTTSGAVSAGVTSIPVNSQTPAFNFASGTGVYSGFPGTFGFMSDMEIRGISPGSTGNTNTPAVLDSSAMAMGEVRNVAAREVASAGGLGHNLYTVLSHQPASQSGATQFIGVSGHGGYFGMTINCAHFTGIGLEAGFTGGSAGAGGGGFDAAFNIIQTLGNVFKNIHPNTSTWAIQFTPYGFGQPYAPQVFEQVYFEACSHYLLAPNFSTGGVIFDAPMWMNLDASTQLAADQSATNYPTWTIGTGSSPSAYAGIWIVSRDELDPYTGHTGRHVKVPNFQNSTWNLAGTTSPYTFQFPFPVYLTVTTAGVVTNLTFNGQSVATSLTAGQSFYVPAGTAVVTTFTTAPAYAIKPV